MGPRRHCRRGRITGTRLPRIGRHRGGLRAATSDTSRARAVPQANHSRTSVRDRPRSVASWSTRQADAAWNMLWIWLTHGYPGIDLVFVSTGPMVSLNSSLIGVGISIACGEAKLSHAPPSAVRARDTEPGTKLRSMRCRNRDGIVLPASNLSRFVGYRHPDPSVMIDEIGRLLQLRELRARRRHPTAEAVNPIRRMCTGAVQDRGSISYNTASYNTALCTDFAVASAYERSLVSRPNESRSKTTQSSAWLTTWTPSNSEAFRIISLSASH